MVIWQSGGGTQPEIGLARMLSARGDAVRILAPRPHRVRVEAAGCEWRPFPLEAEFDPSKGRALEDQEDFILSTAFGMAVPEELLREVDRERPDTLIVDYQMRSALSAAESTGVPTAAVVHTAYRFHGRVADLDAVRKTYELLNRTRAILRLPALPHSETVTTSVATIRRCKRAIIVMPAEFDPWVESLPNSVHVGPIFEEDPGGVALDLPWPSDHPDPLLVVSLSSQYMHQESALERIADAVEGLPMRVLVTTGNELAADEVRLPPSVVVRSYVPHLALLPHASVLVTHAGMGTVMAGFACGVPMICLPIGRDQPGNAQRVQELGAGLALSMETSREELRAAVLEAIESVGLRAGARRMAEVVQGYRWGAIALRELTA
jgi:MGT family glycosyltransferase